MLESSSHLTEVLTRMQPPILLDPEFGLPASKAPLPQCWIAFGYEKTGYDKTGPDAC